MTERSKRLEDAPLGLAESVEGLMRGLAAEAEEDSRLLDDGGEFVVEHWSGAEERRP